MTVVADQADPDAPLTGTHVLHVADWETLARFGLMFTQTVQALAAQGLNVSVLTDDGDMLARLEETPVKGYGTEHLHGWRAWRLPRLLAKLFPTPPDLVHVWGAPALGWLERWTATTHLPLVLHLLGARDREHILRRGVRRRERIIAPASALVEPLQRHFPQGADVCQVIPAAVALPIQPPSQRAPGDTLSVLCVAHLERHTGLDVLVDALAQLRAREFDIQAAVVGTGDNAATAWSHARRAGVQDCISFIDEPHLWVQVVEDIDACVVPAPQPELWLAPLLAMGLGRPVIAAREQTAPWFIEDQTAWQFTPGSAVELAYLLARITEKPKLTRTLTASAAEYVHATHTVADFTQRLITLYGDLLDAAEADVKGGT